MRDFSDEAENCKATPPGDVGDAPQGPAEAAGEPDDSADTLDGTSIQKRAVADLKLLERAIRERWPMDEAKRLAIIRQIEDEAQKPGMRPRNRVSLVRVLLQMEAQNMQAALAGLNKILPDKHEHEGAVVVEHRATVEELLAQPEYVEFLRGRTEDSEPGDIRRNGHATNGRAVS